MTARACEAPGQGQRRGTLEYLRLLKLTSETDLFQVEMMLLEYTSPPYPAWSVEGLRRLLLRSWENVPWNRERRQYPT